MAEQHPKQEIVNGILEEVAREVDRAECLHPEWPTDLLRQVMVVSEEMGEVQKAALTLVERLEDGQCGEMDSFWKERIVRLNLDIDEEAVQVAAMVLRFLYNRRINQMEGKL